MRKIIFFLSFFSIFCCAISFADTTAATDIAPQATVNTAPTTSTLNQTTVAVSDRSATALQLALQAAFSQVMIQISNDPNVMTKPAIQQASTNVTQWVQSYSYIEQPNANPQLPPTMQLQVVFDQAGLQQLLRAKNQITAQNNNSSDQSTLTMMVMGVRNIADYVQMMHALRAKNDVEQVSVKNVQSDIVLLQVKISGNSSQFQQLLASDNNFKSSVDNEQSTDQTQLQYYWMGNQA